MSSVHRPCTATESWLTKESSSAVKEAGALAARSGSQQQLRRADGNCTVRPRRPVDLTHHAAKCTGLLCTGQKNVACVSFVCRSNLLRNYITCVLRLTNREGNGGPGVLLITGLRSYQLVFVDKSGCDRRAGYRRWGWSPKGWSPKGSSPVQVTKFGRGKRWHILPAYAQDGIVLRRVYQGSTDSNLFEDFIAHLLHHCGRYPKPKSVIVMDNASWHHSEKILQMAEMLE